MLVEAVARGWGDEDYGKTFLLQEERDTGGPAAVTHAPICLLINKYPATMEPRGRGGCAIPTSSDTDEGTR